MTQPNIKITRQARQSLMMRVVPGGVEVYIPRHMKPGSRDVKKFIEDGLAQLQTKIPEVPPEQTSQPQIIERVQHWSPLLGVNAKKVQFRDMRRKWGSCSSKGTVTLNTRLCWLPLPIADYVVLHELAHLIELNHSPAFWHILAQHMPEYPQRIADLRAFEKSIFR
jgi:predicted metal-dependent hydrolase